MALPSLAQREALLVEELSRRGFNPAQKAAILGSIKQESSLNPWAKEQGGTGVGLFQWSYGRAAQVPKFTGDYATDVRNQLDLFEKELGGAEKKAGDLLRGANDLGGAAAGMKAFERYGVAGKRYDYMNEYAKRLGTGELKPMGSGSAGGAPAAGGADWASVLQQGLMEGPATSAAATAQRPVGADLADVMVNAIGARPRAGAQRSAGDALVAAILGDQGGAKPEELKLLGPELVTALASGGAGAAAAQVGQKLEGSGGSIGIVDLGKRLQQMGFKVAENPAFGGVGKHSENSHHYSGNALDLTIQPGSPLLVGRKDSDWKALTAQIGSQLKAALPGAEIFHPGDDPVGGHGSHIHLALPKGQTAVTDQLAQLLKLG